MKTLILTALLTLSLSPIFAFAADLTEKEALQVLSESATIKGVQEGVKKDFGMTECSALELTEARKDGIVKVRSICTYQDDFGDEAGVIIDAEASFYDGKNYTLNNITFGFAG